MSNSLVSNQETMYEPYDIKYLQESADAAAAVDIERQGILVFVNGDPDYCVPDFFIDPKDEAGIAIFREFAQKMADHYKNLPS